MIKVIKRITVNNCWAYEEIPNDCKTYTETIKKSEANRTGTTRKHTASQ